MVPLIPGNPHSAAETGLVIHSFCFHSCVRCCLGQLCFEGDNNAVLVFKGLDIKNPFIQEGELNLSSRISSPGRLCSGVSQNRGGTFLGSL